MQLQFATTVLDKKYVMYLLILKGQNTQHISVNFFQKELMVKIYSKSLVRAIGIILCMNFS